MKKKFFTFFVCIFSGLLVACSPQASESESMSESVSKAKERNIYHLGIEKQYLDCIVNGSKTSEGRLNVPDFAAMKIGDLIYFTDDEGNRVICTVKSIGRYDSFNKMLVSEGVINMLPEINPDDNSSAEMVLKGVDIYRGFPGYAEGVKVYGSIAFGIHYDGSNELLSSFHFIDVND